jgi:hypothetical protein
MPVPAKPLGTTKKKWVFEKPTMYKKLKNLELSMDPEKQQKARNEVDRFMGRGTTDNPWEQGPTRKPPDPDKGPMATIEPREYPLSIKHENKSYEKYEKGGMV